MALASFLLSAALSAVPVVPAGQSFRCTPVAIYDTDGPIWCAEGPRLRLNAVAAREADGTCRRGQTSVERDIYIALQPAWAFVLLAALFLGTRQEQAERRASRSREGTST